MHLQSEQGDVQIFLVYKLFVLQNSIVFVFGFNMGFDTKLLMGLEKEIWHLAIISCLHVHVH